MIIHFLLISRGSRSDVVLWKQAFKAINMKVCGDEMAIKKIALRSEKRSSGQYTIPLDLMSLNLYNVLDIH